LLLQQEGIPMVSMDLRTRECDGRLASGMRGELDVADTANVAATVAVRERVVIVDLAGLEFIESSGLAALVLAGSPASRARPAARHAAGPDAAGLCGHPPGRWLLRPFQRPAGAGRSRLVAAPVS
jgi:hypothetical protein